MEKYPGEEKRFKVKYMQSEQEGLLSAGQEASGREIQTDGRHGLRNIFFHIFLPVGVLVAATIVAFWLLETEPQAKPRPRTRNSALVVVKTVDYSPQQTVIAGMGTVAAARTVELKPQVTGRIIELNPNLEPGGYVHKDETLLSIDPTDYRLSLRERATDVAKAKADLQIEEGNQLIAQKEYTLLGETVSEQEKALILRKPQLENLRATLEAARATRDQARVDLGRTEIKAPFNAMVQSREVDLGTRASESTVLATLVGTDDYWVKVSVPVSQLRWVQIPQSEKEKGALVRIYDEAAWGEGVFRQGRVIRLKSGLEEQGRMARLLVRVEDPLGLQAENAGTPRMLLDSYVRVEIEGKSVPSAVGINREYIRDGNSVWVMDADGNLAIRPVQIAFRGADQLIITGGINSGEKMVISDLSTPVAGMPLSTADTTSEKAVGQAVPRQDARQDVQS